MSVTYFSGTTIAIDYDRKVGITGLVSVNLEFSPQVIGEDLFIERKVNVSINPVLKLSEVRHLVYVPDLSATVEDEVPEYEVIERKKVKAAKGEYIGKVVWKEQRKYHPSLNREDSFEYTPEDNPVVPTIKIVTKAAPTEKKGSKDDILTLRPMLDSSFIINLDNQPYADCTDIKNTLKEITTTTGNAFAEFENVVRSLRNYSMRYKRIQDINRSQGLEINGQADGLEIFATAVLNNEVLKISVQEHNQNSANVTRLYELIEVASVHAAGNKQVIGGIQNLRQFLTSMRVPEELIRTAMRNTLESFQELVRKVVK